MLNIISVIGARPQFIKASVVSRTIQVTGNVKEILVHTGQHYDENMSQVFFDTLDIPRPDYNLGIVEKHHGAQTGRMLAAIEEILLKEKPAWVLVYGDTNSTLAGALAASKLHIPLAHVEAGLRSFNKLMPEEINRVLTDHVSDMLFTPTATADENLKNEGIAEKKIHRVGDVMYEASIYFSKKAEEGSGILEELNLHPKSFVLATIHRAENTDDSYRLQTIFRGFESLAEKIPVVLPLHPRTKSALEREQLMERLADKLYLIPPVGYLDMVKLEKNAKVIITDSGGVQKEAYFYKVPCITLRSETEWVELVEIGWNRLLNLTDEDIVKDGLVNALNINTFPEYTPNLYGDGNTSVSILHGLMKHKF